MAMTDEDYRKYQEIAANLQRGLPQAESASMGQSEAGIRNQRLSSDPNRLSTVGNRSPEEIRAMSDAASAKVQALQPKPAPQGEYDFNTIGLMPNIQAPSNPLLQADLDKQANISAQLSESKIANPTVNPSASAIDTSKMAPWEKASMGYFSQFGMNPQQIVDFNNYRANRPNQGLIAQPQPQAQQKNNVSGLIPKPTVSQPNDLSGIEQIKGNIITGGPRSGAPAEVEQRQNMEMVRDLIYAAQKPDLGLRYTSLISGYDKNGSPIYEHKALPSAREAAIHALQASGGLRAVSTIPDTEKDLAAARVANVGADLAPGIAGAQNTAHLATAANAQSEAKARGLLTPAHQAELEASAQEKLAQGEYYKSNKGKEVGLNPAFIKGIIGAATTYDPMGNPTGLNKDMLKEYGILPNTPNANDVYRTTETAAQRAARLKEKKNQ